MSVLPALVRRDALLHVNLSYSDSHEIFLLAPGDEADETYKPLYFSLCNINKLCIVYEVNKFCTRSFV